MIAIFAKEIRENLKWAALAALLLLSLFAWAINSDMASGLSLVGKTMEIVSILAFPAIGFALALLAILPDARRDRWQFVMHRPIDRGQIFLAKIFAAACLYLLATLPTLLAVYAWAATPGHIPGPVTIDLLQPRLADLLSGLMWLSAGVLCAARTARWIGSRLIPIGFALIANVLAAELSIYFWQFAIMAACPIAIMLNSARIAFIEGGELPRKNWLARTAAGASLAVGWAILFAPAIALVATLLGTLFPSPSIYQWKNYVVLDTGQIVIEGSGASWSGDSSATDLDGKPVASNVRPLNQHLLDSMSLQLQGLRPQDMNLGERQMYWGFHSNWAHLRSFSGVWGNTSWFYVVSRNTIEGFDATARRYFGGVGPAGFGPALPFPQPLFRSGNIGQFSIMRFGSIAASDRTVWKIDFDHRRVLRIFVADDGDEVLDAGYVYAAHEEADPLVHVTNVVATRKAVYIFKDGETPIRIAEPYQSPAYYSVEVGRTLDGHLVLNYMPASDPVGPAKHIVIFASADGTVQNQITLPNLSAPQMAERLWEEAIEELAAPPAMLAILLHFNPTETPHELPVAWAVILCVAALSVGLTIVLARRRQYSMAGVWGWAALNLLLGIPGVLLLLSMDDAVPTVRCHACCHARPVSSPNCPHCAADFAPPPKLGIEIFAAA